MIGAARFGEVGWRLLPDDYPALMGDVMLGRKVAEALNHHMRPEEPWGDVLPLLDAADLRT